jgi:hypothetical protein
MYLVGRLLISVVFYWNVIFFEKKKKTSDGMICPSRQSLSQQIRVGGED